MGSTIEYYNQNAQSFANGTAAVNLLNYSVQKLCITGIIKLTSHKISEFMTWQRDLWISGV